jgi:plastocyanin
MGVVNMETKRSSIGLKIRPIMLLAALTLALPWLSRPANAAAVTVHIETAVVDGTISWIPKTDLDILQLAKLTTADTITFVVKNTDIVNHQFTVTQVSPFTHLVNFPMLVPANGGKVTVVITAPPKGLYTYICTIHTFFLGGLFEINKL